MKRAQFDWDKYLATATYAEVALNSPDLSEQRSPTLFSPDHEWIYLSSQDIAVEVDDAVGLKFILQTLLASYKGAMKNSDHRTISIVKMDYFTVCKILQGLTDFPEDYEDPDMLLEF